MCALSSVAQLSISVTMSVPTQIDTDADTPAPTIDHEDAPLQKHRFSFPQCDIGRRSTERRNTVQAQPTLTEAVIRESFRERRPLFDKKQPVSFYLEEENPANGSIGDRDVGSRHQLNSPVNCSGVQIVIDNIDNGDGISEAETTVADENTWIERCYDANEITSAAAGKTKIFVDDHQMV